MAAVAAVAAAAAVWAGAAVLPARRHRASPGLVAMANASGRRSAPTTAPTASTCGRQPCQLR